MPRTAFSRTATAAWCGVLFLAAGLLGTLAVGSAAAGDGAKLEKIERALAADEARAKALADQAAALQSEIAELQNEMIATARRAQDFEEELTDIESTLEALQLEEAERVAALQDRRAQLTGTLSALQRIATQPPEALVAAPGSPLRTVRSAMLLRVAVPAIEDRVELLRVQLEDLALVRRQIAAEKAGLIESAGSLAAERGRLSGLIARKRELERVALTERQTAQERVQRLAAEAKDLRDLLDRLAEEAQRRENRLERDRALREAHVEAERAARRAEAAQGKTPKSKPAETDTAQRDGSETEEARAEAPTLAAVIRLAKPANVRAFPRSPDTAGLIMPARGKLVITYGQRVGDDDNTSRGLTIETRNASQVVAPYDGKVAYAGLFRGYGQILIIEHSGRYHSLLAGLERIDAIVGQWVLAGEPVGVMAETPGGKPRLYVELRRTGQPINPLPWLAANVDKVQG